MIIVNTDKSTFISGSFGGKNFNIPYVEETYLKLMVLEHTFKSVTTSEEASKLYEEVQECIKQDSNVKDSEIEGFVKDPKTGKLHLKLGKRHSALYMPDELVTLMLKNKENKIENTPIINMVRRFLLNPYATQERLELLVAYTQQKFVDYAEVERLEEEEGLSTEIAIPRATFSDLQITAEGYLKTSKIVNEITTKWSITVDKDGKPVLDEDGEIQKEQVPLYETSYAIDEETGEVTPTTELPEFLEDRKFEPAIHSGGDKFFCGDVLGYKYQLGKLAALPSWDNVDCTDGVKHRKGLHVGGLAYIACYEGMYKERLDCFVCPSQIGRFTDMGIGEMAVKEFFVFGPGSLKGTTRGLYHTSTYAKIQSDSIQKAIEEKAHETSEAVTTFEEAVMDLKEVAKQLGI